MLRLKELRDKHNYTQSFLAEYLGVDRSTYTRYELGTRELSLDVLKKLAVFYSTSTDYILGITATDSLCIRIDTLSNKEKEKVVEYISFLKTQNK